MNDGKVYPLQKIGIHSFLCAPMSQKSIATLLQGVSVDLLYTDPAWTQHVVNSFNRQAGYDVGETIEEHLLEVISMTKFVNPEYFAIEINPKYLGFLTLKYVAAGAEVFDTLHFTYAKGIVYHVIVGSFKNKSLKYPLNPAGQMVNVGGENDKVGQYLLANMKPTNLFEMLVGEGRYIPCFLKAKIPVYGMDYNAEKLEKTLKIARRYM